MREAIWLGVEILFLILVWGTIALIVVGGVAVSVYAIGSLIQGGRKS